MLDKLIKDILQGMTPREFLIKYLQMFGVLLFIFYYIYPQALDVRGSSFIVPSAALGLGLYAYNRFPFAEVPKVLAYFMFLLFLFYVLEYYNGVGDSFIMTYLRPQMAWFFSAYLINFILFNVHKNPRFEVLIGYIVGAIILQCIITFAMDQDEWANEFFYSLQMQGGDFDPRTKEIIEEHRLMGYGTALFGAGMVAGYGLILIAYIISKVKLTKIQFLAMTISYCFVFFIGLFSARTTSIGLALSVIFLFILYFIDSSSNKKQPIQFAIISIFLFSVGAGLAAYFFPDYTDWAFEMFENYQKTGKFSTDSSDALYHLFYLPPTIREMLFGTSKGLTFWGNDMGYTRLIWYIGIIGTIIFFGYQAFVMHFSLTKDLSANLLVLMVFGYSLTMNVKGFTDMNPTLYLFFFYFLFYKYYRYYPSLYLKRIQELQQKALEQQKERQQT